MRALVLTITLLAAGLAGCIAGDDTPDTDTDLPVVFDLFAGEPLWNDPQNAPHKAYNWPTMSSPANGTLPPFWAPINGTELPATINGMAHVTEAPADVVMGGGIAMFGSLVYVPGYSAGESYILDVTDPTMPVLLSKFQTDGSERGAAIIAHPDGRLTVAVSTGSGFNVWDITDPYEPIMVSQVAPTQGGHKLGVVPGTPIVYNAASSGGHWVDSMAAGVTEIYDLSDPANPVHVQDFANGYSCHHVYFWNDPANDKHRAICAGIQATQIWDTADPLNPVVIVTVPVHHGVAGTPSASIPIVAFSHFAGLSLDGTTLLVGDELGGGGIPPGCTAAAHTPLGSASAPTGALWFYDVSDETDPTLQGWFSPGTHLVSNTGQPLASCTAHHGRLVPTEGRDLIAMSFYGAGVALIDFSMPTTPVLVDQFNDGTDTWETWYNNGYLFTGDLARGLDVLTFE